METGDGISKPYLTVRETAQALGVHENTVRNWVQAGTLTSSRVPGSSSHRFAREEVERLQTERGSRASTIAPMLRLHRPELIGPIELDRWAATEDAKGTFPELISRMLAATPGVTNIDIRSHEGTSAPGWDGVATSAGGSSFLPAGELRFELGTNKNAKGKAQDDYDKRVDALPAHKEATFVFATPRNWPTGQAWAAEHSADKHFAGVRVLDAHSLASWLSSTPSVHYWISERLGYRPGDAKTIERWQSEFSDQIALNLSPSFFLAGRAYEAERLVELLSAAQQNTVTIRAPWREEAIAFMHAVAAQNDALLGRIAIVEEAGAWSRLAQSSYPLVLIPTFSDFDQRSAEDNGHRVVLVTGVDERSTHVDIDLGKIDPHVAAEALRNANPEIDDEYAVVALARRSLPALVRSHSRDPRLREPAWVTDRTQSEILARLVLAGVFTSQPGDQEVISELTGHTAAETERLLHHLSTSIDAPFVYSGSVWRLTSPVEAGMLLAPKLTPQDMATWSNTVQKVLLEPDPYHEMDTVSRLTASMNGITARYSATLRKAMAESLALISSLDATFPARRTGQDWVSEIAKRLLIQARTDGTSATWERLASVLPLLAEAAPEVFLDAVEADLEEGNPLLRKLFKDTKSDGLGPASPHTHLLWALEVLCWNRSLFSRSAHALATLTTIDPGGSLSNRPLESLNSVTRGWIRHSGATVADKIALIEDLLLHDPDTGWKVLAGVWPNRHSVASAPNRPKFKDWTPPTRRVSMTERTRFIESLTDLAIRYAVSDATRWRLLVQQADSLPPVPRSRLIEAFTDVVHTQDWTPEEQYSVWTATNEKIERHEKYPDAEWAMPSEDLAQWRAVSDTLRPSTDPRVHSSLFDWRAHVGNLRYGDEGFEEELDRRQREAVVAVLQEGIIAIRTLVVDAKIPWRVGTLLADISAPSQDSEILGWLAADEQNLRQAALAYAGYRVAKHGMVWIRNALAWIAIGDEQSRADLMSAVPARRSFWSEVPALGADLEAAYWNRVNPYSIEAEEYEEAVRELNKHELPWSAINVLANAIQGGSTLDIDLVKATFRSVTTNAGPIADRSMMSYYVQTLLTHMEEAVPNDPDLPGLEFLFFNFLDAHHPSEALYRALTNSPSEFVHLVEMVYRAEGEEKRDLTADESAQAGVAHNVLREWPTVPGQKPDGTIDAKHLEQWVRASRVAFADTGRTSIGDEVIGEILSASPVGADSIWPAEPIRELIESIKSARLDSGLHIGLQARRGVTTRGVFDGGKQEWDLESTYRDMSVRANAKWRRTARILRGIADAYREEARRHDAEAEALGDDR